MLYHWQFRSYRRCFKQALQTSHGVWAMREGVILQLMDEAGTIGWGEIAPIPWFGSETVEQALEFCQQLPSALSDELIFSIPDALPCCQFAFESAWESLQKRLIDRAEPQRRRDAENQASFATENLTLRPQNSDVGALNSDVAVQNSAFRPQNSDVAVQNSDVAVQNSDVGALNSTLRPQNSDVGALNSDVAVQNSTLRPQNSDIAVQNSAPRHQDSKSEALFSSRLPTPDSRLPSSPYSALLPAGDTALQAWKPLWEQGFRTFKWKIGVRAIATELELLHRLTQTLPKAAKLRLDANGGLTTDDAMQWLQTCNAIAEHPNRSAAIEYIEQPLNVSQFQVMQDLSQRYRTPIALDESVATLQQLKTCYENGWRGIFVIKPAIVGSPFRLRQFCQSHTIDIVFSSAFETAIGRQAGLRLAAFLGNPDRAVGYGTTHWFDSAEIDDFEQLWQTL